MDPKPWELPHRWHDGNSPKIQDSSNPQESLVDSRPLHIRVAAALGWTDLAWSDALDRWTGVWPGSTQRVSHAPHCLVRSVPERYDISWSATGPLIEKYEIGIDKRDAGWCATSFDHRLFDFRAEPAFADAPLVAVCNLILALAKAGRLKP